MFQPTVGSIYTGPTVADIAKAHNYVTGGFIGGVTMTDQASGFGRGFDVYDDQFAFSFEDMSRDGTEVTQRAKSWIQAQGQSNYVAFAHYFDAHFPYTPKKNLYDPDYKGQIDGTDAVLRPYRDGQKRQVLEMFNTYWLSMMLRLQSWMRRLRHCSIWLMKTRLW